MAVDDVEGQEPEESQQGGDDPLDALLKKHGVGGKGAAPRDPLDSLLAAHGASAPDTLDRASANDSAYTTGDVDFRTPADRHAEAERIAERQHPAIGTPANPIHMAPTVVSEPEGTRTVTRLAQLGQAIAPRDATMLAKPSSAAPPHAPAAVSPALAAAITQAKPALDIPVGGAKIAGSIITSPLTVGRYIGQKNLEAIDPSFRDVPEQIPGVANVTDREGVEAGLQTAALAAGPLLNRLVTSALAKGAIRAGLAGDVAETGVVGGAGRLAPTLGAGAEGATIGAAYDPEHPGRGAALGTLLGVASDVAGRLNGANGRQPQMAPDRTLPRAARPAPTATARIVDEAAGAAPVETAPADAPAPAPPLPVTPEPVAPGVTPPEHVVVRSGVIGPDGAYFRRTGGTPVEGEVAYDTRNAKLLDGTDPAQVQQVTTALLADPGLTPAQRAHVEGLQQLGVIDAAARDTLPIAQVGQALGYDGIQVAPTDPKAPPSVFVWNIRKLQTAAVPPAETPVEEPASTAAPTGGVMPAAAHRPDALSDVDTASIERAQTLAANIKEFRRRTVGHRMNRVPPTNVLESWVTENPQSLAANYAEHAESYHDALETLERDSYALVRGGGLTNAMKQQTFRTLLETVGRLKSIFNEPADLSHGDMNALFHGEYGHYGENAELLSGLTARQVLDSPLIAQGFQRQTRDFAPAPTDEGLAAPPSSAPAGTRSISQQEGPDHPDVTPEQRAAAQKAYAKSPEDQVRFINGWRAALTDAKPLRDEVRKNPAMKPYVRGHDAGTAWTASRAAAPAETPETLGDAVAALGVNRRRVLDLIDQAQGARGKKATALHEESNRLHNEGAALHRQLIQRFGDDAERALLEQEQAIRRERGRELDQIQKEKLAGLAPAKGETKPETAPAKTYDYSSTQLDLPPEHAQAIQQLAATIPDEHLAEDGREDQPHITVKYGLHGNEPEKLRTLLADVPPVTVTLGKTSHFPDSGSGDVVKVDIDSPALHALNKKIADALPHTDTHPEYKPHATVAYVKKGLGKQYSGDASLAGRTLTFDRLTFSGKDGTKVEIPLGGGTKLPAEFDTPEIRALEAKAAAIPSTHTIDTPARNEWRHQQIDRMARFTKAGKVAQIVMGHAGSGKTSLLTEPLAHATGAALLDSDIPKAAAPEYAGGLGATALNTESAQIRAEAMRRVVEQGGNLVFPTRGDPAGTVALAKALVAHGYTVHVRLMDVPPEVSARRMLDGFRAGTRHFVSPRSILEWGDKPRRALHALSQLDGVTIHDPLDNDVPRGTEPRALPDWRERWGFPDSESPGGDAAVRPDRGPDGGPVHGGPPHEESPAEAEGVTGGVGGAGGRRGGAELVQDQDGVSRFSQARTPSGVRRPVARVSTTGLLNELLDMEQKRAAAESRAVYEVREDPNFHTSGIPQIVSTKTPGGGPSMQAKAGKNLADFERITDEIFGELHRRMPKEDIWQAIEDARAERDERAGLTDDSATDASKRDQVHTGTISFARAAPRGTEGPDLFGNAPAPSADDQGALFGEKAGTEASRSLRQTEAAAREEIARLRPIASAPGDAGVKAKARIAELEKLVNRGEAITADELRTRAGAEQGGLAFARAGGSGTPHTKPKANAPVGSAAPPVHPLPEATGLTQRRSSVRFRDLAFAIRALFNPESLGPVAKGTAGTIRHENALKFRRLTIAREALRDFGREIGTLTPAESVRYWDAAEQGKSVGNAAHDAGNALLHQITKERTDELIALGRLKAEAAIANYLGRFWSTPTDAKGRNVLASIMGKRPLEGGKSFLKHRSLERFTDGLDAGLIPATYNYVDAQLAKIAEMERLIAAERMLRTELARGRARKVLDMQGQEAPVDDEGTPWVRIGDGTDPAFTVFGPPAVTAHEAYDAQVRQGLESAIQRIGVTHDRKSATGQRGALGFAKGDQAIVSKFGSHDGVLMHELGHILDARYGLGARLAAADGADKELHDLAVLRHETNANVKPSFREYVQKPEERTANALHALLHAPDRMEQVAPHVKAALASFLASKPELAPILKIAPSLELATGTTDIRIPGVSTIGHWYAPKPAAAVWNNHLSRGLRGNPLYDAYMAPVQAASQLMLGLSGFHGTVIASEGVFSDLALAIDDLANEGGKPTEAPGRIAKSTVAPVTLARLGSKVMREFRTPGTHPELAKVLDAMLAGGFRGTAESEFWTGERLDNLRDAFKDAVRAESKGRRLWGAARLPLDALWAGMEVAAKPILGKYVPLMKTGATYAAVSRALAKLPADASMDQIHATMADVVKEMDYRFGQVVYDNHFTNTVVKHLAQAIFLAPGWTVGTATLMGRGVRDVARTMGRVGGGAFGGESPIDGMTGEEAPPRELVGKSAAYWLGAFAATMLVNGLLTYVNTKEQPHGKDFFAFRDGTKDHDGNWNRHRIPGYIMHDVYGWTHHPVTTFKNKLSPVLAFMERLADNKTYYGDLIYDPDAPTATKLKDVAKAVGQQVAPISVQNFLESKQRGETGPGEVARSAAGVGPAPREFVRTPAQNKLAEYLARRGHTALTPDQADEMQIRHDVLNGLRDHTVSRDSIRLLIGKGELTRTQALHAMQAVRVDPLVAKFKQLSPEEAQVVYALGTEDEQRLWKRAMRVKAANYRRDHGHPLPPAAP